ncbi:MAG: hypothetical protein JW748_08775 [Anaerolineales bacterium]|nr:hypothetical protein [Anaerolineales bacterium]
MNGKRSLVWAVLAAAALCASGKPPSAPPGSESQIVFQFLAVVHEDGSAEFKTILKFSAFGIEEAMKDADYPEEELCAHATKDIESSFGAFDQRQDGKEIWCTNAIAMDNLQGLRNHLEDEFAVNVRALGIEDGSFALDLSWARFPCTTADASRFGCEFSVEAPGEVGDNNAKKVSGRVLTWDLGSSDTPMRFTAESKVGGFDPAILILAGVLTCGCCTVILLIGGAGLFFYLYKRKPASAGAEPPAPAAPVPAPPPADTIQF